ncbi:MAG: insulinase family protein [Candidatus Latescibacter sp.]|nr:insulinase family protein [Candidatus Latescibacter sp.]
MRKLFLLLCALLAFALLSCAHQAQQAGKATNVPQLSAGLDQSLPVDPQVTIGKFDNGLTYYIRTNKKPEKRLELRLMVNAGSILEDDDQQGLAHMDEHMAFGGTTHFAKHELSGYLESIGMRFGPDLNAYTGFDETVYMLQVPTDSLHIVEKAFQILEDWAHLVSYESDAIDKERGVVVEEWRLGRGADSRMRDKQLPILLKDSRYAVRLPIGKKEIIENAPHDTLRRFYHEWYRPELQAVIAVGDFDSQKMLELIKKHFAAIPAKTNSRPRTVFPVPDHPETLFAIATDPEATRSNVSLYYMHEVKLEKTVRDYRRMLIENIYNSMLNERLDELTRAADPPFLYGFSDKGRLVRSKEAYILGAGVRDNGIERGLEALMREAERVRKFGFTQSELERQKAEILRRMEQMYAERDKTESRQFVTEYTNNYLENEPIPGIEYEFALARKYLPDIQLDEINRLAGEWITAGNRVIMVNAPDKKGVTVPSRDELLRVLEKVSSEPVTAYIDTVAGGSLVSKPPKPSRVVEEKKIGEIGVTEWKLSNGARIILKPTDFKNDQVLFSAYSFGGTSLAPDQSYIPAITATSVIEESGLDGFSAIDLTKKLAGKLASVSPWVSDIQEGLSGNCSPADIETMFQLIYLYCTSPRADSTAFLSMLSKLKGSIENRSARPETAFGDTVAVTMAQYHFRARPFTLELLEETDMKKSLEFYRDRFSDAGDFTFLFVGSFDPAKMKPLVETWLGGLPSRKRAETWKDVGIHPPSGVISKEVHKGLEPKSSTLLTFTGPFAYNQKNRYELDSLAGFLRIKLREALREELSGTYGVGVGATVSHYPRSEYQLSISFGSAPENVDRLFTAIFTQIDSLQTVGAAESYLNKVKEMQLRKRETDLKNNSFWLSVLQNYLANGENPVDILNYPKLVEGLTPEVLKQAARTYLNEKNYVRVVLYPEKK